MNFRLWSKIASFIIGWMLLDQIYLGWVIKYGWSSYFAPWAWLYTLLYIVVYAIPLIPLIYFGFKKPKTNEQ